MHDIRAIRENPAQFTAGLARRGMAHAQAITDGGILERNVAFRAIDGYAMCDLGRKLEERTNRSTRALPRLQLEHLPQQYENDDDGGSLKINANSPVRIAQLGRERSWYQNGGDAVEVGGSHT